MSVTQRAARLLREQGELVTFSVAGATPAFDPITGQAQQADPPTMFTAYGYPSKYHRNEVDGESVRAGDVRLVLERASTQPEQGNMAFVDGVNYRVMAVRPVRKSGIDVIFICQLRSN